DHYVGVYGLAGIFCSLIVEPANSNDIQILCTNLGAYAKELMKTCVDIVLDTNAVSVTTPVELMCRGVKETSQLTVFVWDGQCVRIQISFVNGKLLMQASESAERRIRLYMPKMLLS
ncbi:hypothetical protein Tco_1289187, partial [Tanacetum coccineum]